MTFARARCTGWLAAALLLGGCGAGPYGYAPAYAPLGGEARAVAGAREYDAAEDPTAGRPAPARHVVFFGIVEERSVGAGGRALLRLAVRRLAPANRCDRPGRDDSCRVTVTGDDHGDVWALVALADDDDVGPHAVAVRSLLRIAGDVGELGSRANGAPIVHAGWYRHWPVGTYRLAGSCDGARHSKCRP